MNRIHRLRSARELRPLFIVFVTGFLCFHLCAYSLAQDSNLYRNKTHGFHIVFPGGWTQKSGTTPHTVIVAENSKECSVVVQVWKLPTETTLANRPEKELNDFAKGIFEDFKGKFPGAVLHGSGSTYVSNERAVWILLSCPYRQAFVDLHLEVLMFTVFHNERMFQISCGAAPEKFTRFEGVFLNIVRSFMFEDPTWLQ